MSIAAGLIGVMVAVGLWLAGTRAERGAAIVVGGFGFSALCLGNAASTILRSVRRTAATRGVSNP